MVTLILFSDYANLHAREHEDKMCPTSHLLLLRTGKSNMICSNGDPEHFLSIALPTLHLTKAAVTGILVSHKSLHQELLV